MSPNLPRWSAIGLLLTQAAARPATAQPGPAGAVYVTTQHNDNSRTEPISMRRSSRRLT